MDCLSGRPGLPPALSRSRPVRIGRARGLSHSLLYPVADYAKRLSMGNGDGARVTNAAIQQLTGAPVSFTQCPDTNISVCDATSGSGPVVMVAYNPLAQARVVPLRVPVSKALALATVGVVSANGTAVVAELQASDPYDVGVYVVCRSRVARGVLGWPRVGAVAQGHRGRVLCFDVLGLMTRALSCVLSCALRNAVGSLA
jgi:hypothetical protein